MSEKKVLSKEEIQEFQIESLTEKIKSPTDLEKLV